MYSWLFLILYCCCQFVFGTEPAINVNSNVSFTQYPLILPRDVEDVILVKPIRKLTRRATKSNKSQNRKSKNISSQKVTGRKCFYDFCEEVDNYPEKLVTKLLKANRKVFSGFFKPKVPEIGQRANANFENLCETQKRRIVPKMGKSANGKNYKVANTKEFLQLVETEICRERATCQFSQYFPTGYESKCVQAYEKILLLALDEDNKQIITEEFTHPAGCYCGCRKG